MVSYVYNQTDAYESVQHLLCLGRKFQRIIITVRTYYIGVHFRLISIGGAQQFTRHFGRTRGKYTATAMME